MKSSTRTGWSLWSFFFWLAALAALAAAQTPDETGENPAKRAMFRLKTLQKGNALYNPQDLIKAREQVKLMRISASAWPPSGPLVTPEGAIQPLAAGIQPSDWEDLGPGNVGGRMRSILIDPTDPNVLYAGSVGGGIWKSLDRGASWFALNDFMANLAINCMAMDLRRPDTIYAGTGEPYPYDGIRGAGIFKTVNGGTTWTQLPSTANDKWYFVNRIAISPANSLVLLVAQDNGIYRSTDGGATWSQPVADQQFSDIDFNPNNANQCIAGNRNGGSWFSSNGGLTWTQAAGLPSSGRVEVAFARSSPNIVYASADVNFGEIYRSTDTGHSYSLRNTGSGLLGQQGWYDHILWVDPANSNRMLVGGVPFSRSVDGGVTFQFLNIPHTDHHMIVEDPRYPAVPAVYIGGDGGIFRTDNWLTSDPYSINNNLGITQFYYGAGLASKNFFMGGTQDNGSPLFTGNKNGWQIMIGADGGATAVDPVLNPDGSSIWYGETQNWGHYRLKLDAAGNLMQQDFLFGTNEFGSLFIPPAVLDPNGATRLYKGGTALWRLDNPRTTDPSTPWAKPMLENVSGCCISDIAVAQGNSNIVWVANDRGQTFSTANALVASPTWTPRSAGSTPLPGRFLSGLAIDPTNHNRVYAVFASFDADNVWRTENGGVTWTNITGSLPAVPVRTVTVNKANANFVYVGTEVGVFASENRGLTWSPSNDGPANVSVDELFWVGNQLVAATHGRGMFRITVNTPPVAALTAPPNNSTFPAGSTINLAATASDADGSVAKVEFFQGSTRLGEDLTAPYAFAWTNVAAGSYVLTARATDNNNGTGVSAAVNVTVTTTSGLVRNPIADAHVRDGSFAAMNFGTATTMEVKTSSSGFNRDAYLKFDVGGLGGPVGSAKLRIFANLTQAGSITTEARPVTSTSWIESGTGGIIWNTRPALGSTVLASKAINSITPAFYEFDVTAYVQSEVNAGRTLVTLGLHALTNASPLTQVVAREAANNKPELVLTVGAPAKTALLVVGNPTTLVPGDAAIQGRLQALGFTVTLKDDDLSASTDANGKTVVVVSASVASGMVNTKFRATATPVVTCEQAIQDDLGMTGTVSNTDFGTLAAQTQVVMLNSSHPLAAGLSGTQAVATASGPLNWGKPNANAVRIASVVGDPTRVSDYGYEKGAVMPGLPAPGRRVGIFPTDATPATFTAAGRALFDAAVNWAAGTTGTMP